MNYSIIYSSNNTSSSPYISGYCDTDYTEDISTAKSILDWIFYIVGGLIS